MDNKEDKLRAFIDKKHNVYAEGIFKDTFNGYSAPFYNSKGKSLVKQDVANVKQITMSNIAIFLIDTNDDLWIIGYFKYFPYISGPPVKIDGLKTYTNSRLILGKSL